jgi:site-specific DNA recombinase
MGRKKEILHIYTRVSTTIQKEKGFSLQNQRDMGIELSKELNMDYKVWNEGGKSSYSEDLEDREVLCSLIDGMKDGIVENLYVYDIDRLSRNKSTWYLILRDLEKYGVSIYTQNGQKYDLKNEQDELIMGIMSSISQWDNKQRLRRFKQSKIKKFLDGYYVHGTDVFGFERKRVDKGVKLFEHKEQGKIVRKIFQLFSRGKSVQQIQEYLLTNKIKTSRGKDMFSSKQILDMLRRKTYHGEITWTDTSTKKIYNGSCKKIVDDKLWYDVQSRLVDIDNITRSKSRQKYDYLLTGLLYCGVCGYSCRGLTHKSTYRNLYFCGSKNERFRNKNYNKCDKKKSKSVNVQRLDDLVWNTLLDTIENSSTLKEQVRKQVLGEGKKDREKGIQKLVNNKKKLITQEKLKLNKQELKRTTIYQWWIDDKIDDEQQTKMMEEVERNIVDIQSVMKRYEIDKRRLLQSSRWIDWVSEFTENITDYRHITDLDKKKDLLKEYVKSVHVSYDDIGKFHEVEMEILLKLFNDKYVVVGGKENGERIYDIVEGENFKKLKLDGTKVGRKKGTKNTKKKDIKRVL